MTSAPRSLLTQVLWHSFAVLALALLPVLKFQAPWWLLPSAQLLSLAALLAAYVVSALAVLVFVRSDGAVAALHALLITLAVFGLCFAALLALRIEPPRYQLAPIFVAALILIPLHRLAAPLRTIGSVGLAAALAAAAGLAILRMKTPDRVERTVRESHMRSALYNLRVLSNQGALPAPATRGGGLDKLGDEVLLGVGDGTFYALNVAPDGAVQARKLPLRAPLDREEFASAFGGSARQPKLSAEWRQSKGIQTWRFRVADVVTQTDGDALRIFASHHYWKPDERCFVVRVSMLDASLSALDDSLSAARWRTLHESEPCLPLAGEHSILSDNAFRGEEIGGAMTLLDNQTLLLALGDQGFSGIESRVAYAQDPRSSYGKTLRIDIASGETEIYTMGHRNPQGVYMTADGRIWLAEHGPQGGDEINLLERQANYGWPLVTYGVDYGSIAWPFNERQGRHEGYRKPAFAWTPSLGVSSLTGIEGERFTAWRGDLIAGSLATRSLYRLVIEGERIVLAEPIALDERVRDVLELNDGRLLVWTDSAALLTVQPAEGSSGTLTYATLCSGCHVAADGRQHRIGPDLHGIVGRPVASASGFDAYSPALKTLGGAWSEERLDEYLRDPQALTPGTSMMFPGVPDDVERAALIEHLKTL